MATDEGSMTQPPMDLVYEAEDLGWMQMLIGLLRVGRVHFNLAENRRDAEAPFAFLATYTTRLSAQAKAQHLPVPRQKRFDQSRYRRHYWRHRAHHREIAS